MTTTTHDPDQVMQVWRDLKRQLPGDLGPMLDVLLVDGSRHLAMVEDRDLIVDAVDTITRKMDLPVQGIAFMADAYGYLVPPEDVKPQSFLRYSAGEAFRRGDPAAYEMLTVTTIDTEGVIQMREQPYVATPAGPHFGDTKFPDDAHLSGAVVDALREAMRRFQ